MSQSNIPSLEELPKLTRPELVEAWIECFGKPPPKNSSRKFLVSAIAWELQARRYGGLKPSVRRRLIRLAKELKAGKALSTLPPTPRFRPGTRLVREWQGKAHHVTVLEDGFEYHERRYSSLSRIAREITGTRWSGPAFFGLKKAGGGLEGSPDVG